MKHVYVGNDLRLKYEHCNESGDGTCSESDEGVYAQSNECGSDCRDDEHPWRYVESGVESVNEFGVVNFLGICTAKEKAVDHENNQR